MNRRVVFPGRRSAGGPGRLLALAVTLLAFGCAGPGTRDSCAAFDCGANGVCALRDGAPSCLCNEGFVAAGYSCVVDPCAADPCAHGSCHAAGSLPVCRCDDGYGGSLCDQCAAGFMPRGGKCIPGNPCEGDPCVFGLCAQLDGKVACACHQGYAGDTCDRCADGYFAEGLRCVTHSLCDPNPCIHGTCRPTNGEAACQCQQGYAGATCDDCADRFIRDGIRCVAGTTDPCTPNPCGATDPHQTVCVADGSAAICQCDEGYHFADGACTDAAVTDPCTPNPCPAGRNRSICQADGASFTCLCDGGYRLDGQDACVQDSGTVGTRSCDTVVRSQLSASGSVYLRGEFNGWSATATPMQKIDGTYSATLSNVKAGEYAYKVFWHDANGDQWVLDPSNPYTKYVNGTRNSLLRVPDCDAPMLALESGPTATGGSIAIRVTALYGRQRTELDAAKAVVTRNGVAIAGAYNADSGTFAVDDSGLVPGKYAYRFDLADKAGRHARPLFVPVWVEDTPFDWRDATLYFALTDRFANGDAGNDTPIVDTDLDFKANWQGGDFAGLKAKIESGYFTDLGVNCLWVSSPIVNTQGAWWGSDGHKYGGYHSYWPIGTGWLPDAPLAGQDSPIEPHFGDLAAFKAMVQAAHAKGIRVIADFVANHVHSDSPLYAAHRNDATPWFNWDGGTIGKAYVCGWDRPIECWFAEYLPDFDYRNLALMDLVMDHAIWLVQETNIDGFRLDAVKHMILDFSSTLRARIHDEVDTHTGIHFYMVGETFTGEGDGERQTIKSYVSPALLDGQFDFPMFWAVLASIVRQERGLDALKGFMDGNDGYYGASGVMSTFLGNHDVPRALSHAAGQIADMWGNGSKEQGWSTPPGPPSSDDPYKRLRMAWTFLFTQVGVPMIYYGDEIGMPGAGDPDNRRFMRFAGDLATSEAATLRHVQALGQARRRHPALRTGARTTIEVAAGYWTYVMKAGADAMLVALNRGDARTQSVNVGAAGLADGTWRDALTGREVVVSGGTASVQMGRLESAVFERKP